MLILDCVDWQVLFKMLECVPSESTQLGSEYIVRFNVLPIRLNFDQCTVFFISDFFTFSETSKPNRKLSLDGGHFGANAAKADGDASKLNVMLNRNEGLRLFDCLSRKVHPSVVQNIREGSAESVVASFGNWCRKGSQGSHSEQKTVFAHYKLFAIGVFSQSELQPSGLNCNFDKFHQVRL